MVAYNREFARWAKETCEEIIPGDTRDMIMDMYRDNEDMFFYMRFVFDRGGKVVAFLLNMPEKAYREIPREVLNRLAFRMKDLQIPFARYYDFHTRNFNKQMPLVGRAIVSFDACEMLRKNIEN